jgi:hypothetical protein
LFIDDLRLFGSRSRAHALPVCAKVQPPQFLCCNKQPLSAAKTCLSARKGRISHSYVPWLTAVGKKVLECLVHGCSVLSAIPMVSSHGRKQQVGFWISPRPLEAGASAVSRTRGWSRDMQGKKSLRKGVKDGLGVAQVNQAWSLNMPDVLLPGCSLCHQGEGSMGIEVQNLAACLPDF